MCAATDHRVLQESTTRLQGMAAPTIVCINITTQGYPVSSSSTIHTGTTYGFPAASTVSVLPCNERYLYGFTATVARRDMSYTHTFPV